MTAPEETAAGSLVDRPFLFWFQTFSGEVPQAPGGRRPPSAGPILRGA